MHEHKYQLAAEYAERFRATQPAAFTKLAEDVGGTEQARAQLVELYVAEYEHGVAKERERCVQICELARGAGKRGMRLAQELVNDGATVEQAFTRLLGEAESPAAVSLAYRVITAPAKELA